MRSIYATVGLALALASLSGTVAIAAPACKDAAGKYIACPTVAAPSKSRCKDAAGKYIKCPSATTTAAAKPAAVVKPAAVASATAKPAAHATATPAASGAVAAVATVPTVTRAGAPAGATAKCKDGSYSMSKTHSGACSRHGGAAAWLQP